MIVVEDLVKRLAGREVLAGVGFTVARGEIVGLLGANGAGKTTTLRLIAGLLWPDGGRVTIDGLDVRRAWLEARRRLGFLAEGAPLPADLRVGEYLSFRGSLHGLRSPGARAAEVAAEVGVADALHRLIGQLSRGYRQRVALCDALLHRPVALVLDEPTEGLDPNQRRELLAHLRRLAADRAVLLSTHVMAEAEAACDRVVVLDGGKVLACGRPADLARDGQEATIEVEARGDARALAAAVGAIDGVRSVAVLGESEVVRLRVAASGDPREEISRAVSAAGGVLRSLRLEDGLAAAFARLTGRGA